MTDLHQTNSAPAGDALTSGLPRTNPLPHPDRGSGTDETVPLPLSRGVITKLVGLAGAIVLVSTGIGLGGAFLLPPEYAARAELLYPINTERSTGVLREDRNLTTQLVLLRSRQVLEPVAASEHVPVQDLQKRVSATLLDTSEVIQIEARAGSRDAAVRRAQAVVDQYLVNATSNEAGADDYLRQRLGDVQQEMAKVRAGAASNVAWATLQSLTEREQQLLTELDKAGAERGGGPRVVVPPYAVPEQASPRPWFAAATGALTGLLVAAGVVALVGRRWAGR
jgi:capsular polysaccharide biosynthesis protein